MTIFSYIYKFMKYIVFIFLLIAISTIIVSFTYYNHNVKQGTFNENISTYINEEIKIIENKDNIEIIDYRNNISKKNVFVEAYSYYDEYKKTIYYIYLDTDLIITINKEGEMTYID